jgi:hypothetical protein
MPPTSTDEQPPEATKSPHRSTSAQRPCFPGALHAFTTSTWSINLLLRARPSLASSPLVLSGSTNLPSRPAAAELAQTLSTRVKELSDDALNQAACNLSALTGDIDILRIYVPLDEIPFALLDALHTQPLDDSHQAEIYVCVQSLWCPALQQVYESLSLERGLVSTIRKWHALVTAHKFFFVRTSVPLGTGLEVFCSY